MPSFEQLLDAYRDRIITRAGACIDGPWDDGLEAAAREALLERHITTTLAFRTLLAQVKTMAQHLPINTGVCCCGSPMEGHTFYDGHQPRDEGEYFITRTIMDAEEALDQ